MWDNPTRGLDSKAALEFARLLRREADENQKTIITTTYQAGNGIYDAFDKILVLADGRVTYYGPRWLAKGYFESLGFTCPKGANVAGLYIIFDQYGARPEDVDVFYLAGGFGRHLNVESSKRIGLIPNLAESKILQVGNASVEGACIALLSRTKRAELEEMVKRVVHCRLEAHPRFFDFFVEGCQFNPVESSPATAVTCPCGVTFTTRLL